MFWLRTFAPETVVSDDLSPRVEVVIGTGITNVQSRWQEMNEDSGQPNASICSIEAYALQ